MKYLLFLLLAGLVLACDQNSETQDNKKNEPEQLVEIKDGIYKEWYPGKKQLKYTGGQDEQNRRHGKWSFFAENGRELSTTMYIHGLKDGFTVVKYPNGALHYRGEYRQDKMVGIWTTYDEKGIKVSDKDYGYPEE
ncbi:MAG: toxin-antitoxin system YwqK family antitoxin [Bacteroidota bacterium]|jgi:antitoxin component YwqK of YwqJK toxin-antitoxin module